METVKMFDFYKDGIRDALEKVNMTGEFCAWEEVNNDTATAWYIVSEEEEEEYNDYHAVIDKVLREAGCKTNEKVYIGISW